jgi:demethylmenaquinone methyltransferase/2-methoxy-6-polyprenyl-1,4-benzoquinol methylase
MNAKNGEERIQLVRGMFARIASRYDLLNRLMTFGRDRAWRKEAISKLLVKPSQRILDAGSGTGDIALEIKHIEPTARVVAADLTLEMIKVGRVRPGGKFVDWVVADAQHLPFSTRTFDSVISGYLLRNVPDVTITLAEQFRVTTDSARFVSLDTTPPQRNIFLPFIRFHLKVVIPLLGRLIAGDSAAYTYLPETTTRFLSAEALAQKIAEAGFQLEGFVRRMFGSMAIHWAKKTPGSSGKI